MSWKQNRRIELAGNAVFNAAAMERHFQYDTGRTLTRQEVDGLTLIPPDQIRDRNARITGMFFVRR